MYSIKTTVDITRYHPSHTWIIIYFYLVIRNNFKNDTNVTLKLPKMHYFKKYVTHISVCSVYVTDLGIIIYTAFKRLIAMSFLYMILIPLGGVVATPTQTVLYAWQAFGHDISKYGNNFTVPNVELMRQFANRLHSFHSCCLSDNKFICYFAH